MSLKNHEDKVQVYELNVSTYGLLLVKHKGEWKKTKIWDTISIQNRVCKSMLIYNSFEANITLYAVYTLHLKGDIDMVSFTSV